MYLAFASSAFQTQLAYRSQVWASIFGKLVQVFTWIAIWSAVYPAGTSVDGIGFPEMVTYAVLGAIITTAWEWRRALNFVGSAVSTGDVAVYLLKPLSFVMYLFATEAGNFAYRLLVVAIPTTALVALIYGLVPPASVGHGLMFIAFCLVSFLVMFLLATLCGLISFWLMTAHSLEWTLQGILQLLSGGGIPLWLFPGPVTGIVKLLPFAWVSFHPAAAYLGRLSLLECWGYLGLGLGWSLALALAVEWLWRRAGLRITVQGG